MKNGWTIKEANGEVDFTLVKIMYKRWGWDKDPGIR